MIVLIVDDNSISTRVMDLILRRNNYDPLVASSGAEALGLLSGGQDVRAIVTDLMMPEMDGFSFINRLREHEGWRDIPIVVCSALSDPLTMKKLAGLGCKRYVLKPVTERQLLTKVRQALGVEEPITQYLERDLDPDLMAHEHVAGALAELMRSKSDLVASRLEESQSLPQCRDLCGELIGVAEGAALFGARGLVSILDRLRKRGEVSEARLTRAECAALLAEWDILQRDLKRVQPARYSKDVAA